MADFPTRRELFEVFRTAALAVPATKISASMIDVDGSDLNLLAAAASILAEHVVQRAAIAYSGVFESTAKRERLDRVIFDRKGLSRKEAAPGLVTITLARTAGPGGSQQGGLRGSSPQPTRIRSAEGVEYFLRETATFPDSDPGPIDVVAEASIAGLAYAVAPDRKWSFVDPPFDATLVATNAGASAGADDEELDPRFLARSTEFWPSVHRGTQRAVRRGCEEAAGVRRAEVSEIIDPDGAAARVLEVSVIDAADSSNAALLARAMLSLVDFRCGGIPVVGRVGTIDYFTVEFTNAAFDRSIVSDTGKTWRDVQLAIVAAAQNQRPGERLYRSTIITAARSVPGFVFDVDELTDPLGTLLPSSRSASFRTRLDLITLVETA